MTINLLTGNYDLGLGYESLYHSINQKIKQYESYIDSSMPLEDIEWRERKITQLTSDLHLIRHALLNKNLIN